MMLVPVPAAGAPCILIESRSDKLVKRETRWIADQTYLLFGRRGSGKTTIRMQVSGQAPDVSVAGAYRSGMRVLLFNWKVSAVCCGHSIVRIAIPADGSVGFAHAGMFTCLK